MSPKNQKHQQKTLRPSLTIKKKAEIAFFIFDEHAHEL